MGDRRIPFVLALLLGGAGLLASCGGTDEAVSLPAESFAIVANADVGIGDGRVLIGIAQPDGTRLGSPDIDVSVTAAPFDDPAATQTVSAEWTWMVEDVIGLYRAVFDFDRPGPWQLVVEPEVGVALEPAGVNVLEPTFSPSVGEVAPVLPTPTMTEYSLEELTTDPEPDRRFYEMSLDDAVESGKPTVLVFSTPAYCQTSACGPLLDIVKQEASSYPDVNFIHVEVYTGLTDPDFRPDMEHLAPAAGPEYWNLVTEPWVFVIDGSGIVQARFEGVMAAEELRGVL